MYKCVRKHRCTPSSLTLIVRWDGNPTAERSDAGPTAYVTPPTSKLRGVTEIRCQQLEGPVRANACRGCGLFERDTAVPEAQRAQEGTWMGFSQ